MELDIFEDKLLDTSFEENDDLYHYGIKGMKWGRRLYQNKDGSLTALGQRRYNKEMTKIQKEEKKLANERAYAAKMDKLENARKRVEAQRAELNKKKNPDAADSAPKQKSLSEMSDSEVASYKQRLTNERDIRKMQKEIYDYDNPKTKGKIEKFADGIGGQIVKQVWNDVAKKQINSFLEKNLGLKEPLSELDKLKKEADLWRAKKDIALNKKQVEENSKKYEELISERKVKEAKRKSRAAVEREAEKANRAYDAKKKHQSTVDEYNSSGYKDDRVRPVNDEFTKRLTHEKVEQYKAKGKDVFGEGTSRFDGYSKPPARDTVWDGERYVDSLFMLEDRKMRHSDTDDGSIITNVDLNTDSLEHFGIKGMKWGVHRFYNKDGSRTAAGKKRENEARKNKDSNHDGDPETRPELYYKSSKSSFVEALSDYVPSKSKYGFVNDLEISKDIGGSKNVSISIKSAAKDENTKFASDSEMKSRAEYADDFIKRFNDNDMRDYLTDNYKDHVRESVSNADLKKQFKLVDIRINPDWNIYEATYTDNGLLSYHAFTIEGDVKTGKPYTSSMDG